ncbi:MAG: hypothetical protein KDM91_04780, partial [Verrucomicrobiae bacterium]|nr:hypothetical protein [Verrucomicrobiae bacterium]
MKPSLRFPVCLGVWCALLAVLARPDALRSQDAIGLSIADLPPVEFSKQVYQANPGPWGDLEYYYTYLEAPDSLIDLVAVPSQQTVWRFMGKTPEEVKALFNDLQLDDRLLAELVERSIWYINDEEVRVHPTADAIVNLPMPARQSIFAVLRQWEENPFHRAPVIIESANVREWFADTGLSPEVAGTIESLSYKMGRSLAFSDVPYVLGKITTDAEERSFMKALTRTRSLILRLKVSPQMDFEQVADYWTAGYKNKDILPILESVLRTQGVERLDVAHLLPPTPRKHLYTYPPLSAGMSGRYPDCFWT